MVLHRTAQGKMVDMEALRLKNELVPAVGSLKVNARGDEIGSGGKIVRTKEEIMSAHYKIHNNNIPQDDEPVRNKDSIGIDEDMNHDPMEEQVQKKKKG